MKKNILLAIPVFILAFVLLFIQSGCRKKNDLVYTEQPDKRVEAWLQNAKKADPKYARDVALLTEHLKSDVHIAKNVTINILWNSIASIKDNSIVFFPTESKDQINGFFLVNKKTDRPKVEFYSFGEIFKKENKTLNCMQAFNLCLMMNKTIKNVTRYQYPSANEIPLLFKELKNSKSPNRPPGNAVTVATGANTELCMTISNSCTNRVCDWVELPNFVFLLLCVVDESGCFEGLGGVEYDPGLWYATENPYQPTGGGTGDVNDYLNVAEIKDYVISTLNLEPYSASLNYTNGSPHSLIQTYYYLKYSTDTNKIAKAKDNYYTLFEPCSYCWNWWDYPYASLTDIHASTSTAANYMWWEDANWLSDSTNLNTLDTLYNRNEYYICKKSFKFYKFIEPTGGVGGWQVAGTRNIHFNVVDFVTRKAVRIQLPTIYFGLPVIRMNGEYYSSNRAAEIAADAVDWAEKQTYDRYKVLGGTVDVVGLSLYFRQKIHEYMSEYFGMATLQPGSNINVTDYGDASYPWPIIGC